MHYSMDYVIVSCNNIVYIYISSYIMFGYYNIIYYLIKAITYVYK